MASIACEVWQRGLTHRIDPRGVRTGELVCETDPIALDASTIEMWCRSGLGGITDYGLGIG